ncbi:MAG: VWA containing CoxE family protein [Myxococcota bacterium]
MFDLLFFNLRSQGVKVGLNEWLTFLGGLKKGLVVDMEGLYAFGRAVLCTSEGQYDAWDVAFHATFAGVELPPNISEQLLSWLADARGAEGDLEHIDMTPEQLREEFLKRLQEQKERHDGGNRWVGTGGRSPFGNAGKADRGIRVGGQGGGRSAIEVAGERQWLDYRTDTTLQRRDFQIALRALKNLVREGSFELDLDGTIRTTANNGGYIDLEWQRERTNRVHLVLLMDTGGSMTPHSRLVERLLTAADETKGFKSFTKYQFHNVPYGWLYRDYATYDRVAIPEALRELTPQHRLIWVGDASMAPWELFTKASGRYLATGDEAQAGMSGLDWLQMISARCPHSVWLNPDPPRFWDHPTVRSIGTTFPMYPLTIGGLRDAVKKLKRPV